MKYLISILICVVIVGCRAEDEVRWTTSDARLEPYLIAASDWLGEQGYAIWRDDGNPNTHVWMGSEDDAKFQMITPPALAVHWGEGAQYCFANRCETEKRTHFIMINPWLFRTHESGGAVWAGTTKRTAVAHEFGHALGLKHVEECPHFMNISVLCQEAF